MNKWKVNLKIWQVDIKIWQDDRKIWQVNIIIWQVMADICHHRSLLKCITLDFDIHVFALILHFSHPCQTVFSTCCISLSLPVRSTTSSAYTIIIHRYPYSSFDLLLRWRKVLVKGCLLVVLHLYRWTNMYENYSMIDIIRY